MSTSRPNEKRRYKMPNPSAALTDRVIMEHIDEGSRVLDLGCGDGILLSELRRIKNAEILGVEMSRRAMIQCMTAGVPVIQADLDLGLEAFPSQSFDFAVLSQTLQQVRHPHVILEEMLRVANRALVVVPNFGHWRVRWNQLLWGRAPVSSSERYQWYNTPNLHLMSMPDFRDLVDVVEGRIVKELAIIRGRAVEQAWAANVRADSAVYILERKSANAHAPLP